MSKSAGNVVLLRDVVERGLDPRAVRFCLLENRYRSQMDLSWDAITAADKVIDRWRRIVSLASKDGSALDLSTGMKEIHDEIFGYFATDLDSPRALHRLRAIEKDSSIPLHDKAALLIALEPLLGLDLERAPKVSSRTLSDSDRELLDARIEARRNRDFKESDRLRDLLAERGIEVRDAASGQEWHWL